MPNLLRRPQANRGLCHSITPAQAGWSYVGFSLYQLKAGERISEQTGDTEVILVMVEGKAAIKTSNQDWGTLGERMSVWEKTPPHMYLCLPAPRHYYYHNSLIFIF